VFQFLCSFFLSLYLALYLSNPSIIDTTASFSCQLALKNRFSEEDFLIL